jgi:hypothetical protein
LPTLYLIPDACRWPIRLATASSFSERIERYYAPGALTKNAVEIWSLLLIGASTCGDREGDPRRGRGKTLVPLGQWVLPSSCVGIADWTIREANAFASAEWEAPTWNRGYRLMVEPKPKRLARRAPVNWNWPRLPPSFNLLVPVTPAEATEGAYPKPQQDSVSWRGTAPARIGLLAYMKTDPGERLRILALAGVARTKADLPPNPRLGDVWWVCETQSFAMWAAAPTAEQTMR